MKSLDKIPTSKISRASKIAKVGTQVGVNYLKYYGEKLVGNKGAKQNLDEANAADIYNGLSELKGSALKMAQMMSMDKHMLPQAYVDKFSLSQFSVPPLSGPLVRKTIKASLGADPSELFDTFDYESKYAASIGQVHLAEKNGQKLAVKVQYPGVADSIHSDLQMVKPIATRVMNLKGKDLDKHFDEIESKLIEETDYVNELNQSVEASEACKNIPNIEFPEYLPELSSNRVLTMTWKEGIHLSTFGKQNESQQKANEISQTLWDFYMYQIHTLRKVHADPHPGNFLVAPNGKLVVLDFGCMKVIPEDFYTPFFRLTDKEHIKDKVKFMETMEELELFSETDSEVDKEFLYQTFHDMLLLMAAPFHQPEFDFSDPIFFKELMDIADSLKDDPKLRKLNGSRGSKHLIYVNRTFFGLYSMLNDLNGGKIKTHF